MPKTTKQMTEYSQGNVQHSKHKQQSGIFSSTLNGNPVSLLQVSNANAKPMGSGVGSIGAPIGVRNELLESSSGV